MYRTTSWASLVALGMLAAGCGTDSGETDREDVAEKAAEDAAR